MKTPTKAVLASMVVLALCLCTIGGVTYSWYSSSDQSQIEIDTAKVDIELQEIEITGYPSNIDESSPSVGTDNKIAIKNLAPGDKFNVRFTVSSEKSSIDIIYRAYLAFDTSLSDELKQLILIGNNESDAKPLTQATTVNGQSAVIVKDWTSMTVDGGADTLSFFIGADENYGTQPTGSSSATFTLKVEAFQSNYPIPMEDGSVEISGDAPNVSGEVDLAGGDSGEKVQTKVSFDSSAAEIADGQTLSVTATDGTSSTSGFQIGDGNAAVTLDLNLDEEGEDFGNGIVTVTTTVPMKAEPKDIRVIHIGSGTQPTVIDWFWNTGKLTVTFTTDHFSEFVITESSEVTVSSESALIAALKSGMDVTLGADIKRTVSLTDAIDSDDRYMSDAVVITGESTLDLAGHTLTNFDLHLTGSDCNFTVKDSVGNGSMTYDGFECPAGDDSPTGYLISAWEGATAVVESGMFTNNIFACVYVMEGKVTINGGTFEVVSSTINSSYNPDYARFTLNLNDAAGKDGTAVIEVKGGTFYNYDPSASASENPLKDYVPEGYTVTSTTSGEDTLYTVSAEAA